MQADPKLLTCPACGGQFQPGDPFVATNDNEKRSYHLCPRAEEHPFVPLEPTELLTYEHH